MVFADEAQQLGRVNTGPAEAHLKGYARKLKESPGNDTVFSPGEPKAQLECLGDFLDPLYCFANDKIGRASCRERV